MPGVRGARARERRSAPPSLLLAACFVLLAGCAGRRSEPPRTPPPAPGLVSDSSAPAPSAGVSRPPSALEAALIRELMRETEQLRGLHFRAPVAARIQDRAAMRGYVEGALEEQELTRARRRYVALGLLDPQLDIRELIASLMEEELVGYYDPEQKLLAVRDDVARLLAGGAQQSHDLEWRATVVHELVHALQDQHLGLSQTMHQERSTDAENAFGALVEGDATLAMLAYAAQRQGGSIQALVADRVGLEASLRGAALLSGGALARAPALVREPLLFRYREGALFAAQLFAQGGWASVDEAHRHPPRSTAGVVHPAIYLNGSELPPLEPPELAFLTEQGCPEVDRDVLGSLETSVALAAGPLEVRMLSDGWRGDRYAVLACAGGDASVWFLRFAEPQQARRARAAFARLADSSPRASTQRWSALAGTALVVARNLAPAALLELEARFRPWASAL
jgi:hypothetical protein